MDNSMKRLTQIFGEYITQDLEGEIKELPLNILQYRYRGADIVKRVDDFKTQIEKGGV